MGISEAKATRLEAEPTWGRPASLTDDAATQARSPTLLALGALLKNDLTHAGFAGGGEGESRDTAHVV